MSLSTRAGGLTGGHVTVAAGSYGQVAPAGPLWLGLSALVSFNRLPGLQDLNG